MKAAVVHAHGQPPRYEDFPDPRPAPGEALVHVAATGLHPLVKARAADQSHTARGQLPLVPGVDGVGRLEDGSRVYFVLPRPPYGTFSELTVVRQAACFPVPDGMTAATAAGPGPAGWARCAGCGCSAPPAPLSFARAGYVSARMIPQRPDWFAEHVAHLVRLLAKGAIQPRIHRAYRFTEAAEAHHELGTGNVIGKVVLVP